MDFPDTLVDGESVSKFVLANLLVPVPDLDMIPGLNRAGVEFDPLPDAVSLLPFGPGSLQITVQNRRGVISDFADALCLHGLVRR